MSTRIVMLPIDKFDRIRDAEPMESNTMGPQQIDELRTRGAAVLELSEFMDLCNDQQIDLGGYWISYITHVD